MQWPIKLSKTNKVMDKEIIEKQVIDVLQTVYDPEIPINIYSLGLIYKIEVNNKAEVIVTMTLTAPNCPVADDILEEVRTKVANIDTVKKSEVILTFEPTWNQDMMSEEAKLELGFM